MVETLTTFFQANSSAIQAFAGLAQAFFALILTIFTVMQIYFIRQQTRIQRETREIAIAALGRPYIFFEFVSHSFEEWRNGKSQLGFVFRLTNYGTSPAVVHSVIARAFLSKGPETRDEGKGASIHAFPDKSNVKQFILESPGVLVARQGDISFPMDVENIRALRQQPFSILPRASSELYGAPVHVFKLTRTHQDDGRRWYEAYLAKVTSDDAPVHDQVRPWLIGQVIYEDIYGRRLHTSFCVHAEYDGSVTAQGSAPYNERT